MKPQKLDMQQNIKFKLFMLLAVYNTLDQMYT